MLIPEGVDCEILVVDNNSNDNTREEVHGFIGSGKHNCKYLFEPTQGKVHALNRGMMSSQGEILGFTDDDVLVDKHWIREIVETFRESDAVCVGGKVLPIWESARPHWLTDQLLNVLAILDYGDELFEYDWKKQNHMLFGVNFSFRKTFFIDNGLFNVKLGSRSEDQEMFDRLRDVKAKVIYNPRIVVNHRIHPERLTKSYFRKWYYDTGRARAKLSYRNRRRIFGIPGYMIRNFLTIVKKFIYSILSLNREGIFYNELWLMFYSSFFLGKLKQSILRRN
jgi:glycosyltransferase involved in cell wall biosynthesis